MTLVKRGRHLNENSNVFEHNAWDDYEMDVEAMQQAKLKLTQQAENALSQQPDGLESKRCQIESQSEDQWNKFYDTHTDKFFKDRKWLFSEFSELIPHLEANSGPCHILELGCGVGNTTSVILDANKNPELMIYSCDISQKAIEILGASIEGQRTSARGAVIPFHKDLTHEWSDQDPPRPNNIDFIMMIFTFSAVNPDLMESSLCQITNRYLRAGGMVLFRDYARYDMTQLRFKPHSYLGNDYYCRGDGTTTFFFTEDRLHQLFSSCDSLKRVQLYTDRRLLCNRAKALKMCRCWIQAKYIKQTVNDCPEQPC
ncbi:tRNA N(3)-methylcytidine methyltransferase METTL2, partial [Fragariocoptes setiger]